MSTLEQAARKALEWMEGAWYQIDCEWGPCGKTLDQACADGDAPEIEALRAALAAPKAQAVGEAGTMPGTGGFTMACFKAADVPVGTKLYAAPQPAAPSPERVPLTEERARLLSHCGPVVSLSSGKVERTPAQYRSEIESATYKGIRLSERAHGITKEPQA